MMFSLVVTLQVKADQRDRFLEAIEENAAASVREEPGCLRFDVCMDREDPNRFYFYEVYADHEAFEEHRRTPHFAAWREAAAVCVEPGSQQNQHTDLLFSNPPAQPMGSAAPTRGSP